MLVRREAEIARELREEFWAGWKRPRPVVLTLKSPPCQMRRLEGRVKRVAVTGAFVLVDDGEPGPDIHVPVCFIEGVHRPHFTNDS